LLTEKIKSLNALKRITAGLKKQGKKIVFTNGCFDLLHYGHVKYLEDAREKGDALIVAINSDASIKKIKGKNRPITSQKDRSSIIAALESVDYAVIFNETTPIKVIKALKPDILIKGADWQKNNIVGSAFILGNKGKVLTVKLVKGRSTTNLIHKIARISQNKPR